MIVIGRSKARIGPDGNRRSLGQDPGAILAGKAKHQQSPQIDRSDPHRPPDLVAFDAAVGHPSAAVATSHASERSTIGRQRR
jgi:hypothetical protein